jgi:hypothetical protein
MATAPDQGSQERTVTVLAVSFAVKDQPGDSPPVQRRHCPPEVVQHPNPTSRVRVVGTIRASLSTAFDKPRTNRCGCLCRWSGRGNAHRRSNADHEQRNRHRSAHHRQPRHRRQTPLGEQSITMKRILIVFPFREGLCRWVWSDQTKSASPGTTLTAVTSTTTLQLTW